MTPAGTITTVTVQAAGEGLRFGSPQLLFDPRYASFAHAGSGVFYPFALTADGQRVIVPLQRGNSVDAPSPLVVVLNWTALLQR